MCLVGGVQSKPSSVYIGIFLLLEANYSEQYVIIIIELIYINLINSILLGLSYLFLAKGLLGIGFAWIIGQGLVTLIYFGVITNKRFIQF